MVMLSNWKIRERHAVAGVIEALLLVALIAVVISIIQLEYIPQIMEQREAEHMDEVSNQFSHLKTVIDMQSLTGSMETDVPLAYMPMISLMTLGSRELPYLITARAFGELNIIEEEEYKIETLPPTTVKPIALTSIEYQAYNSYFIDQTYVLEGGGLILSQYTGKPVMRADPSIRIENLSDKIEMQFYLPKIIGIPGKNSTYGYGRCFIRTNYSNHRTYLNVIPVGGYIIICSNYLNAWNSSLNGSMEKEIKNGYVDVSVTQHPTGDAEVVKISVISKPIYLELTIVDIYVQIGPGWVI